MVNSMSPAPLANYPTSNGYYLVRYENMTLEICFSVCQTNGFMFIGLETYSGT
jgi:hypothetical protein